MIVHQSDLAAASRCLAEYGYKRAGVAMSTNSGAAFGSVMHHAVSLMEREIAQGMPIKAALSLAIENFDYYWNPATIHVICEPVPHDGWLRGQSQSNLRTRGIDVLRKYADLLKFDDTELLATEFGFMVPVDGTWDYDEEAPHVLAGSVDRLGTGFWRRQLELRVDDYKTGKDYTYLRQNLQGSAYSYATTKREFWVGWGGEDGFGQERGIQLHERFEKAGRHFTWINLKTVKREDGGWRGWQDYRRLAVAVEQFTALVKSDIYPLAISGATCRYCPARHVCAGSGIPDDDHGKPKNPK